MFSSSDPVRLCTVQRCTALQYCSLLCFLLDYCTCILILCFQFNWIWIYCMIIRLSSTVFNMQHAVSTCTGKTQIGTKNTISYSLSVGNQSYFTCICDLILYNCTHWLTVQYLQYYTTVYTAVQHDTCTYSTRICKTVHIHSTGRSRTCMILIQ